MKGTEAFFLSAACAFKLNIIADDIIDVAMFANMRDIFISYPASHVPILTIPTHSQLRLSAELARKLGVERICARIGERGDLINGYSKALRLCTRFAPILNKETL
jgi:hypothetical protein